MWSWEFSEWHCRHVSIDKWGRRVFVQLLKAYGLTEQSRALLADTGSCGSTQSTLWDLATHICVDFFTFFILFFKSVRRCVWRRVICTCQPLPLRVKFRFCVCVCVSLSVWCVNVYTEVNMLYCVLTASSCSLQVHNVSFSFELMQDGGLERPKPRPEGRTHI